MTRKAAAKPHLKSQNAISSVQTTDTRKDAELYARTHGGRRTLPLAFTEHGAIMAAAVLNSEKRIGFHGGDA